MQFKQQAKAIWNASQSGAKPPTLDPERADENKNDE